MLPSWLHDVFLGYGNPKSGAYYSLSNRLPAISFSDTFLDAGHLANSFPGATVADSVLGSIRLLAGWRVEFTGAKEVEPPYYIEFPSDEPDLDRLSLSTGYEDAMPTASSAAAAAEISTQASKRKQVHVLSAASFVVNTVTG